MTDKKRLPPPVSRDDPDFLSGLTDEELAAYEARNKALGLNGEIPAGSDYQCPQCGIVWFDHERVIALRHTTCRNRKRGEPGPLMIDLTRDGRYVW